MGVLKNLTKEYFGEIEREEAKIDGVEENHKFTDKNGKFHEKGFFITNGENKILRELVLKLVKQRGPDADLNDIDVSNIYNMSRIFAPTKDEKGNYLWNDFIFYGDVSGWDVSSVKDMDSMFYFCDKFNCDISKWDVSNVINMCSMFCGCYKFNQNIGNWNTSKVIDMSWTFGNCTSFNQDLSGWKTKNATTLSFMFYHCDEFNQSLNKWNVSNVKYMNGMFAYCSKFNKTLSKWKLQNVESTNEMFKNCESFKKDLSMWEIPKDTKDMFLNCPIKDEFKPKLKISESFIMGFDRFINGKNHSKEKQIKDKEDFDNFNKNK